MIYVLVKDPASPVHVTEIAKQLLSPFPKQEQIVSAASPLLDLVRAQCLNDVPRDGAGGAHYLNDTLHDLRLCIHVPRPSQIGSPLTLALPQRILLRSSTKSLVASESSRSSFRMINL